MPKVKGHSMVFQAIFKAKKNKNFVSCNMSVQNLDPRPGIIFILPITFFPDSQNFFGNLCIKGVFGLLNWNILYYKFHLLHSDE